MSILYAIWCALIKFTNLLIDYVLESITNAIAWLIALLPSFPVIFEPIEWGDFGNAVGYFLPIAEMIMHFSLMLALIIIWYSVQHIMRLIRLIK
jgi:hypothetical protein